MKYKNVWATDSMSKLHQIGWRVNLLKIGVRMLNYTDIISSVVKNKRCTMITGVSRGHNLLTPYPVLKRRVVRLGRQCAKTKRAHPRPKRVIIVVGLARTAGLRRCWRHFHRHRNSPSAPTASAAVHINHRTLRKSPSARCRASTLYRRRYRFHFQPNGSNFSAVCSTTSSKTVRTDGKIVFAKLKCRRNEKHFSFTTEQVCHTHVFFFRIFENTFNRTHVTAPTVVTIYLKLEAIIQCRIVFGSVYSNNVIGVQRFFYTVYSKYFSIILNTIFCYYFISYCIICKYLWTVTISINNFILYSYFCNQNMNTFKNYQFFLTLYKIFLPTCFTTNTALTTKNKHHFFVKIYFLYCSVPNFDSEKKCLIFNRCFQS